MEQKERLKTRLHSVPYPKLIFVLIIIELAMGIYEMTNKIHILYILPFPTHWIPEWGSIYCMGFFLSMKNGNSDLILFSFSLFILSLSYILFILKGGLFDATYLSLIFLIPFIIGVIIEKGVK